LQNSTCGRGNTAEKTTIQETVRQHKTEEEKPTSLPTPKKGERKRFIDFSTLHEARAHLQDHSETEKELNLGKGSERKRLSWRMHPPAAKTT
jgi:hypothetical protein